ncbi:MAG: TDT family transporter [Cellulosilyticaceae bacterium]
MNGTIKNKFSVTPIGMCGTAVAMMTLGNCWNMKGISVLKPIAFWFAVATILLQIGKLIFQSEQMKLELKDPITGSFYPTIDMALFLIASYILPNNFVLARTLWFIALSIHMVLIIYFFRERYKTKTFGQIAPSWFVVIVGVVVGAVSSPGMGVDILAKILWTFGTVGYFIMWPIMFRKIIKGKLIEKAASTIGIMAAPASLCLVGYITVFENYNIIIMIALLLSSWINLILVYTCIPRFFKDGFKPELAAFTFPLAISIMAMYKVAGVSSQKELFMLLGDLELLIGTGIILYIAFHFTKNAIVQMKNLKKSNKDIEKNMK